MIQAKMVAPGRVALEQVQRPTPSAGEVLVAVLSCGVCGSDLLSYRGLNPFVKYPYVFGHELVGEVAGLAGDVCGIAVGQRAAILPYSFCGRCRNCLAGRENLCPSIGYFGGLAEYIAVPAASIIPIPDNLSADDAALIEPVAVGVHAAARAGLRKGDNLLIFGAGAVGLSVLQVARAMGAAETIVVDLAGERLHIARQLGAGHTVNAGDVAADAQIAEWARAIRIDTIFECVGAPPALLTAVSVAEKGAKIVVVGTFARSVDLSVGLLQYREVDLITCSSYVIADFRQAIELLQSGAVNARPLLSAKIPLNQIAGAFDSIVADAGRLIKVVVTLFSS